MSVPACGCCCRLFLNQARRHFFYEKYEEMKKKILWKALGSTMKWYGGWKLCVPNAGKSDEQQELFVPCLTAMTADSRTTTVNTDIAYPSQAGQAQSRNLRTFIVQPCSPCRARSDHALCTLGRTVSLFSVFALCQNSVAPLFWLSASLLAQFTAFDVLYPPPLLYCLPSHM